MKKASRLTFFIPVFLCGMLITTHGPARSSQRVTDQAISIQLQQVVAGLANPLFVTSAHDGTSRLFIVEQGGQIKVLQHGSTTPTVFLDISSRVLSGGERGLLGLAFHPSYATNGLFFVYYTRPGDGALVTAEYHASADPNVADTTETVILTIPHPTNANHNGGMLAFGPDGFLYMGPGDGGAGNDPPNNAQNSMVLLGKILRIDIDHPNGSVPYSSPPSNPFFGTGTGRDEIFAMGMRNPWRFSFDSGTGTLYVGDVGQGAWEEIDTVTVGGNYGWRVFEGMHCTGNDPALCTSSSPCNIDGFTCPIAEYGHLNGRCAIIGGYAYRGAQSSLPAGAYIYGDLCTGEIIMLSGGVQTSLLTTGQNISSFGVDEAGEIYVCFLSQGVVSKILGAGSTPPSYAGFVDRTACDVIAGWAADRNRPNTVINVELYDGTTLLSTVPANISRPDVGTFLGDNGLHGFSIATPASLKDGTLHSIHVKFETSTTELSNSPANLTCVGGPAYVGYVDHLGCDTVQGWAADHNRPNTSINVEIYDGTTLLTTVLANNSRPDVGSFLGDNGLHGFSLATPSALKDGNPHTVHIKFETTTTELSNSPASLTCTGSPLYIGYVDHLGCDTIQGWAADRNRPNTSINVEIYNGSTPVMTVLANNSRPDVGSFLGDNGLHGFSIPFPASLKDNLKHNIHVKFEASSTELNNSPVAQVCP